MDAQTPTLIHASRITHHVLRLTFHASLRGLQGFYMSGAGGARRYAIMCVKCHNRGPMAEKTILVIEDDHNIVELLRIYLTKEGFNTEAAYSGTEGLKTSSPLPNPRLCCWT